MNVGDYMQVRRRVPPRIRRGTRGTLLSLDGDWATLELPTGGRVQVHQDNLTRLVRAENGG